MRALVLEQPGRFAFRDATQPAKPAPGEALVRVHRVGICGTDLHAFEGKQTFFTYPRVLGHELAVEVVAVGEGVTNVLACDRCAVEPYLNCGRCSACQRGKTNCCESMRTLGVHVDGGMQELLAVPAAKLHTSRKLTLVQLAFVEPLCIGAHAVVRAELARGEHVLVIGAGPIGLSVLESLRAAGAHVTVMEISQRRLEFCRTRLRIERVIDAGREKLSGELPTAVFDCTGSPRSMTAAFDLVAHGGKLIFVGHFPGDITFHDPHFHGREMTLYATRNATATEFRRVIAALEDGSMDPSAWTSEDFAPDTLAGAFPRLLSPESGLIKPVMVWSHP